MDSLRRGPPQGPHPPSDPEPNRCSVAQPYVLCTLVLLYLHRTALSGLGIVVDLQAPLFIAAIQVKVLEEVNQLLPNSFAARAVFQSQPSKTLLISTS